MLTAMFFKIVNHSPKGRRIVFRGLFEYLARRCQNMWSWTQMNYGYAEGAGRGHTVPLQPEEEHERYCHQLYFRAVNGVDLSGKDVVEVSCGRGGGAAFVHRYFKPRTMTGVDIASGAVAFCRRTHRALGLRFLQGDAEELPLFDASADALVNIEASFCYGDLDRFFGEVNRVLRPKGYFFYADLQAPDKIATLIARLKRSGFEIMHADDITANVSSALELDAERREDGVRASAPFLLRHAMGAFAGTRGSRIPAMLANGKMRYFSFTLRKHAAEQAELLGDRTAIARSRVLEEV